MDAATSIAGALKRSLGGHWSVRPLRASGFCSTWQAQGGSTALFLKSLPLAKAETLEAEADGLAALGATSTVRVPHVMVCSRDSEFDLALLALEWLEFGAPDGGFGARFGAALGALHRAQPSEGDGRYGWRRDNLLGATPQTNRWSRDRAKAGWIEFFGRERLGAMRARLGATKALLALLDAIEAVIDVLPAFFADGYVPRASLIHGDLWSGNWGMLADGTPVIYDPAVSCSDAEAELAMMELFGAPPHGFWPAYREVNPLHAGYAQRRRLYQLYHLLNHAVLFGGSYVENSLELARSLVRRADTEP
jgi:fructosamine-3-kinase